MCRIPYEWRGDPELANAIAAQADEHGTWITAIDDQYLPLYYPSINLWSYLGKGLDKQWISMSVCQTGDTEDFLRVGRAIGEAIATTDRKVILIATGSLSHTFYPLRELRKHEASDPSHIVSQQGPRHGPRAPRAGSTRAATTASSTPWTSSSPCGRRASSPTT